MIIVRLKGGLGNQLFQYAAARSLSIRLETELKLDISNYASDPYSRKYSLTHFNIQENFATQSEIEWYTKLERERRYISKRISTPLYISLNKMLTRLTGIPLYYYEKSHAFNKEFFSLPSDVYLDGYWQTEKYFLDIKELIENEFTLKEQPDKRNASVLAEIIAVNSVSVHIRRTETIIRSRGGGPSLMASCPLNYFENCAKTISKYVRDPVFFVFSDDINWVKNNLTLDYPTHYVDHNDAEKDYMDLFLMSHCKHNIMPASTFSWWGAWLNSNHNKIVLTPKYWYKRAARAINYSDLILQSWTKIDNKCAR